MSGTVAATAASARRSPGTPPARGSAGERGRNAPGRGRTAPARGSADLLLACGLALATALIHVQAAADHLGRSPLYAVLFVVVAAAQISWAVAAHRRPSQRVLLAGAAMSLAIVCVWAVSRTVGLPIGPDSRRAEQPDALDVIATVDELGLALLIAVCWARGRHGRGGLRLGRHRARPGEPAWSCRQRPDEPVPPYREHPGGPTWRRRGHTGRRLAATLRVGSLSLILLSSMLLGGGLHAH